MLTALIPLLALAPPLDDGWLGNGGTPQLMGSEHPQVEMVSELILIQVGPKTTAVDCQFVFKNTGPATTVKMGFPDEDWSREDDGERVKPVFHSYDSWIDGQKVKTNFGGAVKTGYFHSKPVEFKANQTVKVRDKYVVNNGIGYQGGKWYMDYVGYTLHTGANWKGPIQSVDVRITFDKKFGKRSKLAPTGDLDEAMRIIAEKNVEFDKKTNAVMSRNLQTVFFSGPCKPTLSNGEVRFFIKNLEPSEDSDIFLKFHPHQFSP